MKCAMYSDFQMDHFSCRFDAMHVLKMFNKRLYIDSNTSDKSFEYQSFRCLSFYHRM